MVLMSRAAGSAGFFALTQASDDLFVIRSWNHQDGTGQEIRPRVPVSGSVRQVIAGGMPLPRDRALLGWVADNQVTAMLAVHCGQPEAWGGLVPVPEIRVMPMAGTSELLHWPPFTVSPLDDGRLWDYIEWGQIVDVAPLVAHTAGRAFWVPCPYKSNARRERGCVVVTSHLPTDEYWLPAGVYMDHWMLREGIPAPPADRLLSLPGVVDLARRPGSPQD
jgi:hypothetical protein